MTFKPNDTVADKKRPKICVGIVFTILESGSYKKKDITKKNRVVLVSAGNNVISYWEHELVKFRK